MKCLMTDTEKLALALAAIEAAKNYVSVSQGDDNYAKMIAYHEWMLCLEELEAAK